MTSPKPQIAWDHENFEALEKLQAGDVEPLISLLNETDRPLHPELRRWIAAMLEKGDPSGQWWLKIKRLPGFPRSDDTIVVRNYLIGRHIHRLYSNGSGVTDAKGDAADKFKLGDRTIDDAWTLYRRVYPRLKEDDPKMEPDMKALPKGR